MGSGSELPHSTPFHSYRVTCSVPLGDISWVASLLGHRQVLHETSSGKGYFVNLWAVAAPHPFHTRKQMVWSNAIICATTDRQTILSQISSQFHSVRVYPRLWPLPERELCDSSCSNHTDYYTTVCRLRPFHKNMDQNHYPAFVLLHFSPACTMTNLVIRNLQRKEENEKQMAGTPLKPYPPYWSFNIETHTELKLLELVLSNCTQNLCSANLHLINFEDFGAFHLSCQGEIIDKAL